MPRMYVDVFFKKGTFIGCKIKTLIGYQKTSENIKAYNFSIALVDRSTDHHPFDSRRAN